jgi:hypothetical protein
MARVADRRMRSLVPLLVVVALLACHGALACPARRPRRVWYGALQRGPPRRSPDCGVCCTWRRRFRLRQWTWRSIGRYGRAGLPRPRCATTNRSRQPPAFLRNLLLSQLRREKLPRCGAALLARLADSGAGPDQPPRVRLGSAVPQCSLDDFAATAGPRFLELNSASTEDVLEAHTRAHLRRPLGRRE